MQMLLIVPSLITVGERVVKILDAIFMGSSLFKEKHFSVQMISFCWIETEQDDKENLSYLRVKGLKNCFIWSREQCK